MKIFLKPLINQNVLFVILPKVQQSGDDIQCCVFYPMKATIDAFK